LAEDTWVAGERPPVVDVPPTGSGDKPSLIKIVKDGKRAERPPPCRQCHARSWWNGWRVVFPMVATLVAGIVEQWELPLAKAKCSSCKHGFTCYPPGIYPQRRYQLDVVAEVVAEVVLGGASAGRAAQAVQATASSARRWVAWVAQLAKPHDLLVAAARLDPDAPAGVGFGALPAPAPAARVLLALEQLGSALLRAGVAVVERTGLGRVLGWQHAAHEAVFGLGASGLHLSPATVLGGGEGGS
jgi:hypothetical protein